MYRAKRNRKELEMCCCKSIDSFVLVSIVAARHEVRLAYM
jgi:hypothetical protein